MRGVRLIFATLAVAGSSAVSEESLVLADLSVDDECHSAESGSPGCALNALQRRGLLALAASDAREGEECHTAVQGEACFEEVDWAKRQGINEHPEWYPNLTPSSSDAEFQQAVHLAEPTKCPAPCAAGSSAPAAPAAPGEGCHTAVLGEACFDEVWWAQTQDINEHPDRYPGLTASSSEVAFQQALHQSEPDKCPMPCGAGGSAPAPAAEAPAAPAAPAAPNTPAPPAGDACHTAVQGETCFNEVQWAKSQGINQHPEWYPGLTSSSSDADFQQAVHQSEPTKCPMPCGAGGKPQKAPLPEGDACHTAVQGETCFNEIQWAKSQGINQHPEWYPGLTSSSSDADFQQAVHQSEPTKCPVPCGADGKPKKAPLPEGCHDAVQGEACFGEITWAKNQGIQQHPEWYPGLTQSSSDQEFQQAVYMSQPDKCPQPCIPGGARARPRPAPRGPLPGSEAEAAAERGKWCASSPPPPIWQPSPAGPAMQVKILSYNLFWWNLFRVHGGNHNSAGRLIASTSGDQPYDFMGFQECEDPVRVLAGAGLLESFGVFQGRHAVCVAYNKKRWMVLGHGNQEVAEDMPQRWYGKRGAQWMRLKNIANGRTALFVNHHGPLSVNSGGVCGGRATANNLLKLMVEKGAPGDLLILVGDFNANAASGTIQNLWPHLVHVHNGDSWGGVDNIFSNTGAVVSGKTLGDGGSDHHAISAVVAVGGGAARVASATAEPGKSIHDLRSHPPGHDWSTFWCGKLEPDVDYEFPAGARTWSARDGRAPDWCCRECQADRNCVAWRWSSQGPSCTFSASMPSGKVGRPGNANVVSGLPAPSAANVATSNSRAALRG